MKKLSYLLIIIIVAPIFLVTSCDGTKRYDFEEPTVEWIRFNVGDTVMYTGPDPTDPSIILKDKIILVNEPGEESSKSDIILLDRPLKLSGSFTDNIGLSAAVVRIWGDTLRASVVDTCYRYRKVPTAIQLYGYTERLIEDAVLVDRLPLTVLNGNSKELNVRTSESETDTEYSFSVFCTDIEGNQDTTSFQKVPLIILTRKLFLEMKGYDVKKLEK